MEAAQTPAPVDGDAAAAPAGNVPAAAADVSVNKEEAAAAAAAAASTTDTPAAAAAVSETSNKEEVSNNIIDNPAVVVTESPPPPQPDPEFLRMKSMPVREYLESTVVPLLLQGLQKLVLDRPKDPVDYLIDFLTKNKPSPVKSEAKPEANAVAQDPTTAPPPPAEAPPADPPAAEASPPPAETPPA